MNLVMLTAGVLAGAAAVAPVAVFIVVWGKTSREIRKRGRS